MASLENETKNTDNERIKPLSDKIISRVTAHRSDALRGVVRTDPAKLARDYLDLNRSRELFQRLEAFLPKAGGTILEMGSGFGPFVAYAAKWGKLNAYGMEPNPISVTVCRDVQKEVGTPHDHVLRSIGENTPFASNSMDLVVSFTVFEHVNDPSKVLTGSSSRIETRRASLFYISKLWLMVGRTLCHFMDPPYFQTTGQVIFTDIRPQSDLCKSSAVNRL